MRDSKWKLNSKISGGSCKCYSLLDVAPYIAVWMAFCIYSLSEYGRSIYAAHRRPSLKALFNVAFKRYDDLQVQVYSE
jgi:hypothetical protein